MKNKFNKMIEIYRNTLLYKYMNIKEENKKINKDLEDLDNRFKSLINLKNIYLSELRVKNLENGRLKKKLNETEKELISIKKYYDRKAFNLLGAVNERWYIKLYW